MDRDGRSSYRDRMRQGQTGERDEYDWPDTPRGTRRGPGRDERPRDGMTPPSRSSAPGGSGRPSRAG